MGLHTTIFPHSSFHTDDKETKDATAADGSIGRNGCPCALWWKCPFPPHLSKPIPYTCYCKGRPLQVSGHKRKLCCTAGSTKTMPSCQESLRQSLKTNWSSMLYWAAFSSGFTQPPSNPKHVCSLFSKVPRKGLFVAIYNGTVGWKMCFTRNEQAGPGSATLLQSLQGLWGTTLYWAQLTQASTLQLAPDVNIRPN